MKKEVFAARLRKAAEKSRDFSRRYLEEELPDEMRFRLRLNSSYDGNPLHEDERVFPEDGSSERAAQVRSLSADEVVAELWRDGEVPEWLDISVMGLLGPATLMHIMCCGRFTSNENLLYHRRQGLAPFSVHGPVLPVGYEDGDRFSIYHRSTCWTREELTRISEHAPKVWSLDLHGPEFDDETLGRIPIFDALRILWLHASPLRGSGLAALTRQPKLEVLRINGEAATLSLECLPKMKHLETLDLTNLSDRPIDLKWVWKRAKRVDWLVLDGRHLVFENHWAKPLSRMTVRASKLSGDPLPKSVGWLNLHLPNADDAEVDRLLRRVRSVQHLSLAGTPVTDTLVESLVARFEFRSLNVHKTRVSEDFIRRLSGRHRELRITPALDASPGYR